MRTRKYKDEEGYKEAIATGAKRYVSIHECPKCQTFVRYIVPSSLSSTCVECVKIAHYTKTAANNGKVVRMQKPIPALSKSRHVDGRAHWKTGWDEYYKRVGQ